jgi:hypothetical protein
LRSVDALPMIRAFRFNLNVVGFATKHMGKAAEKPNEALGCLFAIAFTAVGIWYGWQAIYGCLLAEQWDYMTTDCALSLLRQPTCSAERDILGVDEVKDSSYTDNNGTRHEIRTVVYRFLKRPVSGPVSAGVLRDTAYLFKADGKWRASCEGVQ